jgi:phosphoglycerate dehydrogenase-like enzyme
MPKVVMLGAVGDPERLRHRLDPAWQVFAIPEAAEPGQLQDALGDADALIAFAIDQVLPPVQRLRLVQVPGAGYDRIPVTALPRGCSLCNVYEHETSIAEYVLLGMLEWTIGMRDLDRRFREGDWCGYGTAAGPPSLRGELAGKTLGILGFGHIGREVARRAKTFGMRVGAITRTPRPSDALDWIVPTAELDARLPACDFLLIACPLNESTRGLIDSRRLTAMKRSAVLVNVARGEVVDESALYEALLHRTIAGAVIDVWYIYPSSSNRNLRPAHLPFYNLPNVIMTPHVSGWTEKLLERRWSAIADNLKRLAEGAELNNVVYRA